MLEKVFAYTIVNPKEVQYEKIKNKQWAVYYYLVANSNQNINGKEKHRYIYKNKINISKISKILKMSRPTFYAALEVLKKKMLIWEEEKYFIIDPPESYTDISPKLMTQLLCLSDLMTADLLRVYLFCKLMYQLNNKQAFSIKNIVECLGHSITKSDNYKRIKMCIYLLERLGLIKMNRIEKMFGEKLATLFQVEEIEEMSKELDDVSGYENESVVDVGLDKEMIEKIKGLL